MVSSVGLLAEGVCFFACPSQDSGEERHAVGMVDGVGLQHVKSPSLFKLLLLRPCPQRLFETLNLR